MLATDELVRKAITNSATLQKIIPQLWAAELEYNLRKRAVLQQSIVVNEDLLVPNAGDTVYIPSLPDIAQADDLTEGVDMTPIALNNATSVPFIPIERGKTVDITRKALDRIKYDGIAAIVDRLAYSMSLKIENTIAGLWNATVPGTTNQLVPVYANGKTNTNVTAADIFNDLLLLNAKKQLMSVDAHLYDDGMWMLYISPAQYAELLQDQNVRNDLHFAVPGQLICGEVGILHNCHIIVTNFIQSNAEGASSGVPVWKAILTSPRWAAIAYKRHPEIIIDPTLYDLGRRRRFGSVADFDIELLHAERAVVVCSA